MGFDAFSDASDAAVTRSRIEREVAMKARLVPVFFESGRDEAFDEQVVRLHSLLAEAAEILAPVGLGSAIPEDADAVVFPQVLGDAYGQLQALKEIAIPIVIITSEFGTVSMWDWEVRSYLRSKGVATLAPYNLEQARRICKALGARRRLDGAKFLVFQDDPGEGMQASIFKRFYWWEDECIQRMRDKFGVAIVKKSFETLGAQAQRIPDEEADEVWEAWQLPTDGVPGRALAERALAERALRSAVKHYIALKREIQADEAIVAAGENCLNESYFSDTTPCLAWSMLYEESGLIWGCEADTMAMLTQVILHESLDVPIMMTNLYPFLMGQAALKHENIPRFPDVEDPEDHVLVAHCGYLGVVPRSFCTSWCLRPKVLAIVDDNATALDGRLPTGEVTLAKLGPALERLSVVEGYLEGYVQYPGSDCLNGGVIRVSDGPGLMDKLVSHHYLLMTGHHLSDIEMIAPVFGLQVDRI